MKAKKIITLVLAVMVAAMSFAGCGNSSDDTTTTSADGAESTKTALSGTVATDGSTSMEKVIGALGEAFTTENSGVNFTYNPTGSGTGITAISEGRCDIGLSSRALKDEEKAKGLEGTTLALDGIAMIVNSQNGVSNLTVEQIASIYTGEVTNWKDVGGKDAEIVVIGREAGSGTRDGFESITKTADDVITAVSQNPDAIGYASLASVKDTVKALNVDGVTPTEETVKNGSYKIQRPFVLVTKSGVELSAAAKAFFDYATSAKASEIIAAVK